MEEDIDPEVLAQRLRAALRRMEATTAEFNREQQWDVFFMDDLGAKAALVHNGFHRDIAETVAATQFVKSGFRCTFALFRHNASKPERTFTFQ